MATDEWFAQHEDRLAAIAASLASPEEQRLARRSSMEQLAQAADSAEAGLEPKHHQAAALLGRGAAPDEIEKLTGVTPAELAILETDPIFGLRVEEFRGGWANEKIAEVQRFIDSADISDANNAATTTRLMLTLLARRERQIAQHLDVLERRMDIILKERSLRKPTAAVKEEPAEEEEELVFELKPRDG